MRRKEEKKSKKKTNGVQQHKQSGNMMSVMRPVVVKNFGIVVYT